MIRMNWKKKGLIFAPNNENEWMQEFAAVPIADRIDQNFYRILFTPRDSQNRSHIGFIEIDIENPTKILKISKNPLLSLGKLGSFDEMGVMTASLVNFHKKKYLYYIGWNQTKTVPFRLSIGLAISDDDGQSFTRYSDGPILDRNYIDPYFVSAPWVIFDNGIWRMYYISALKWEIDNQEMKAPYHIRYAESKNGIDWKREGIVCIDFKNKNETKIARPCVCKEGNMYKMLYCYGETNYRIGYAESIDGIKWQRKDELAGIDVSNKGWDSEMIEYPFIFEHNAKKYLLYNGNDYGKTGMGLAVLDEVT